MNYSLRSVAFLISASLALAGVTYMFNVWFLSFQKNSYLKPSLSPLDASFIEGVVFILSGVLALVGSGGISKNTEKAAMLAATASALGEEVIGPSESFRRDAWKPKGLTGLGLTLIMTGIILLGTYFIFNVP